MTTKLDTTLGAVLAITTGKLVCPLDDLYELQDHIVGRHLMTHERTVGWDRQTAALLALYPELAEAEFPGIPPGYSRDGDGARAICDAWVDRVAHHVGWSTTRVEGPIPGCEVDPGEALDRIFGGR